MSIRPIGDSTVCPNKCQTLQVKENDLPPDDASLAKRLESSKHINISPSSIRRPLQLKSDTSHPVSLSNCSLGLRRRYMTETPTALRKGGSSELIEVFQGRLEYMRTSGFDHVHSIGMCLLFVLVLTDSLSPCDRWPRGSGWAH